MKNKIALLLLTASIFFISCGNTISQDGTGSITVDAGAVVKNAGRHAINNIFLDKDDGKGDDFIPPEVMPKITTELVIRLSTEGDFAAEAEESYLIEFNYDDYSNEKSEAEKADGYNDSDPYQEIYSKAFGSPVTIKEIPAGSSIRVHAEVLQRIAVDYTAYIQWLRGNNPGITDEEIKYLLESFGLMDNMEELIADGYSDNFIVQSGDNPVTIKMAYKYSDEEGKGKGKEGHGYGDEGGNGGKEESLGQPVILYNNVPGRTDNALYSFDMKIAGNSLTADNRQELIALDEYTLLDYESDAAGTLYYLVRDAAYDDYVKIIKPDNTSTSEKVASSSWNMSSTKLAIDAESGNFFYGGLSENYFYIDTLPGCGQSNENSFEMSAIDNYYSSLLDFTVSLGEPSVVTNEGTTTTTYSNAVAYIAMLKDSGDSSTGRNNDIFFIKNPFTYTITDNGINVTTAFNMSSPTSPVIYLSQTSFNFPYNNYFGSSYSVTDMIIHNGYLYSLLSLTDGAGPYDEGSGDGGFPYSLYSYGALVKIKLDDFSISGVTVYGYDDSNCTDFNGIEATDSKTINFEAYQPAYVNAPYFFGPRKFVAIKPKELVISDDGYFYYMDGSDFCYKNVDRLVVYNEDNNELKAYLLDTAGVIKFDNHADSDVDLEVLGTGGMSRNPVISATCKYRQ